jgi:fumarylacetoacetate (FAA) hydrolase
MLAAKLHVSVNGAEIGRLNGDQDAVFTFPRLIAHLARTRNLVAGSIIGAGTVSNRASEAGVACLYEKRSLEVLATGAAETPWLKFGDTIRIEALDTTGRSLFGAIEQTVQPYIRGATSLT